MVVADEVRRSLCEQGAPELYFRVRPAQFTSPCCRPPTGAPVSSLPQGPMGLGAGLHPTAMAADDLNGWKEIAAHLGKAVRTAQRWEQELGMPVRRIPTPGGEIVYARSSEIDEWKQNAAKSGAGRRALQAAAGENGRNVEATPAPAPRTTGRPWLLWAGGGVVALGAIAIAVGLAWGLHRPAAPTEPKDGAVAPALGPFTGREGLDAGPWPIAGHDMRRSNQSHLSGPAEGRPPRLLRKADRRVPTQDDLEDRPLITIDDRTLAIGSCGSVQAVGLDGREVWRAALAEAPVAELPRGFGMSSFGVLIVTTHDCTPHELRRPTRLYGFKPNGETVWKKPQTAMNYGPGIGPRGTVLSISETNVVTMQDSTLDERRWKTDLPGYGHGAVAVDSNGNLYIGTDGGVFHNDSLWCLASGGDVRWSAGAGTVSTPVVTTRDRIVIAGYDQVHCFAADGRQLWSKPIGSTVGSLAPLAVGRSGIVYARSTSGLVAIDGEGRQLWSKPLTGGPRLSPGPILDKDENVYVGLDDQVCSFASDGKERWCVPFDHPGTMIIAAEGLLVLLNRPGDLYAIGAEQRTQAGAAMAAATR